MIVNIDENFGKLETAARLPMPGRCDKFPAGRSPVATVIHNGKWFRLEYDPARSAPWIVVFPWPKNGTGRFSYNFGMDHNKPSYHSTIGHALHFVADRRLKLSPEQEDILAGLAEIREEIKEIKNQVIIL